MKNSKTTPSDLIADAFEKSSIFKIGTVYSRREIESFLKNVPGSHSSNPMALTYNRWNVGMLYTCPLFEYVRVGRQYKYLGKDYKYNGITVHSPRGKKAEYEIGNWKEGKFTFNNGVNDFAEWRRSILGE